MRRFQVRPGAREHSVAPPPLYILVDDDGQAMPVGNGYKLRVYDTLNDLLGAMGLLENDLEEISILSSRAGDK